MNLSSALEFSSQSPVSVYGTGISIRFSWKRYLYAIAAAEALAYYQHHNSAFNVLFRKYAVDTSFRRFLYTNGTGILTRCTSTSPSRVRVSPRLTLS